MTRVYKWSHLSLDEKIISYQSLRAQFTWENGADQIRIGSTLSDDNDRVCPFLLCTLQAYPFWEPLSSIALPCFIMCTIYMTRNSLHPLKWSSTKLLSSKQYVVNDSYACMHVLSDIWTALVEIIVISYCMHKTNANFSLTIFT